MKLDWKFLVRGALMRIEGIQTLDAPPKRLQKLSLPLIGTSEQVRQEQ
jgi:hypothetical protein